MFQVQQEEESGVWGETNSTKGLQCGPGWWVQMMGQSGESKEHKQGGMEMSQNNIQTWKNRFGSADKLQVALLKKLSDQQCVDLAPCPIKQVICGQKARAARTAALPNTETHLAEGKKGQGKEKPTES